MKKCVIFVNMLLGILTPSMGQELVFTDHENFNRHALLPRDPANLQEESLIDLEESYKKSKEGLKQALQFAQKNLLQAWSELSVVERNRKLNLIATSLDFHDTDFLQSLISLLKKFEEAKKWVKTIEAKLLIAGSKKENVAIKNILAIERSYTELEAKLNTYLTITDESIWEGVHQSLITYLGVVKKKPLISRRELNLDEALDLYFRNPDEESLKIVQNMLAPYEQHSEISLEVKYGLLTSIMSANIKMFTVIFNKADILNITFHCGHDCIDKAVESYKRATLNGRDITNHLQILKILLDYYKYRYHQRLPEQAEFANRIANLFFDAALNGNIAAFNFFYPYIKNFEQFKDKSEIDIAFDFYIRSDSLRTRTLLISKIKERLDEPELIHSMVECVIYLGDGELLSGLINLIDMHHIFFDDNRNALDLALDAYLTNESKYADVLDLLLTQCKLKHMKNAQSNSPQERIDAILFHAIESQNVGMYQLLYPHASKSIKDAYGNTLIHKALSCYLEYGAKIIPILRILLTEITTIDMHSTNTAGQTILESIKATFFKAAEKCDIEAFQLFHSFIRDMAISDRDGNTCLHMAATKLLNELNSPRKSEYLQLIQFIVNTKKEILDISNSQQLSPRQILAQCDVKL